MTTSATSGWCLIRRTTALPNQPRWRVVLQYEAHVREKRGSRSFHKRALCQAGSDTDYDG